MEQTWPSGHKWPENLKITLFGRVMSDFFNKEKSVKKIWSSRIYAIFSMYDDINLNTNTVLNIVILLFAGERDNDR